MDISRGNSNSEVKDFQSSWISVTPETPILTKPQPICADRQENQSRANWLEPKRFMQENQLDQANGLEVERFQTQAHRVIACCDSTNSIDINRGFNSWEAALASKSQVSGDNANMYNKFSIDTTGRLKNIPFADLLALADAATADSENATQCGNVNATSSPYISVFHTQIEGNRWFESSSANSSFANLWSTSNCAPDIPQYGSSIPQSTYDSPPRRIADAVSSRTISSHFAPVTPDQTKRVENNQVFNIPNLSVDGRANQTKEMQKAEVATTRVEVCELHDDNEQSQLLKDLSCAVVSTPSQENHNLDKGGNKDIDLNKTPQQKPRRRKHRPKVVIEGQPKRTRKAVIEGQPKRTRKAVTPKPGNPTGKRKYVRRNGVNKSTATPSAEVTTPSATAEVTSSTTDPKTVERTTKSCRRSLNFDLESQVRDESSPPTPPSNFNSESQAQNFYTRIQSKSTVQLGQGREVTVEKTQVGIAYDLTHSTNHSMNQVLEGYTSIPEMKGPSPSIPTHTNPPHEQLKDDARNEGTKGKCRIVFSNETHDKQGKIVVNTDAQSAPRSPNESNCSSSACLTKRKQARRLKRLKREHSCTIDDSQNVMGAHYNSLQEYLVFPMIEYNNNKIAGMHFPAIYKKKRTEKGHNSTTSSTLSTVTAAENSVRQATAWSLHHACENPFTSKTNCRISDVQFNTSGTPTKVTAVSSAQNKEQTFECMLALSHTERLTKKRSKGPTRVRDLASLIGIVDCKQLPTFTARGAPTSSNVQGFEYSHQPHTCMEALVADTRPTMATKKRTRPTMATKKRTKRNSLISLVPPNIYNHHQFLTKSIGPTNVIWKSMSPMDAIVEQLERLDINGESNPVTYEEQNELVPYNMRYHEQNALVLYQRDGTIVPFGGWFDPVKKRRPRAKVELDEETNRVWKLLLENINSEGIDGTDEEKAKWWEEERRVFRGRADSFIARMHLVQGDRRFSQWKGSVVDSVVGVFLTQNVSDHLSSSAFMSLAARFPLKSKSNHKSCSGERTNILVKEWHEEKSNQPACDRSSMTLHDMTYNEEKEVVNSNESFGSNTGGVNSTENSKCKLLDSSGNGLDTCHESEVNRSTTQITGTAASFMGDQTEIDVLSSQNSVVSSQNSVDSSIAQTADRTRPCLQSNSESDLTAGSKSNSLGSTSFVQLLQMAGTTMLHGVYNHVSGNVSSNKKDGHNPAGNIEVETQKQNKDRQDGPKASFGHIIPSSNYGLHLTPNSGILEVGCFDMLEEESRFSDIPNKKQESCMIVQSGLTAESVNPMSSNENNHPCNNLQGEVNKNFQSQSNPKNSIESQIQEVLEVPDISGETLDVLESTIIIDNLKNTEHKAVGSNLNDHGYLHGKTIDGINTNTSKAKRGRMRKEKQNAVDWDILRKQAQANGKRRERTANTMDSLDWEAVRCADVNEIANTIKERGMNNMLAERIKDFLNRLVREHGSTDLEWLRDVPPDKAKEYLLSVRGLGLKSVECVRLLTLHHLAFPVDTNVGRIAVRLGWVPLQPLPESLQLHLLELYPVLESIQKYLWPRLCKLDQRTLYELHYQMITFGKVFCTKSKPNCNACPMRGECRHFASAFASARLALPGPEEKSIVSATNNKAANQNPMGIINSLQLPLPQANQQPEAESEINNYDPIIEVPSTPEPIIEVPATPEPECTQISESDIEDTFYEDPDEIPTIKLNIEEFTQNLQSYMQQNMELQEGDMSKALVALTTEAASIPMPKLKNVSRLRTEHQVYELPDSHPLLEGLDKREPDDPCSYLLAIWTPGETANSIQPPEGRCTSQEFGKLCDEKTCFSCNSIREANSQTVRGTLLIPCRTAMRGSFPLNGTYFQVNEVFADHDSSINPIDVPRAWIWNLPRRTVYFGTSIPTIFKGLSTEGIQYCFWRGLVCVRGFDQKTRAPRPLMARLHFPASKLTRTKGKTDGK